MPVIVCDQSGDIVAPCLLWFRYEVSLVQRDGEVWCSGTAKVGAADATVREVPVTGTARLPLG